MNKLFLLILSALFLVAFAPKSATVELSLKGKGDKVVTVCRADSDLQAFLTSDTLRMIPGQATTIEVPTVKLTTILLSNSGTDFSLIVEPGKSYKLSFERGDTTTVAVDDSVQKSVMEGKSFYKYEFVRNWVQAPLNTVATHLHANFEALLRVSVGREDELWQNTIKYYNIRGHHIRASRALHEDFYNKHNVSTYPHYMLVDADGKIAIARMKDLSEGERFYEQLKEALKL